MMLSCKEASRLSSQSLDRKLETGEWLALRFHLLMCRACTRVENQMKFLRRAIAEMPGPPGASDQAKSWTGGSPMSDIRLNAIQACVFDAYGTLFDVNSAAADARDALGDAWQPLAELWRLKQLQYTWLRGLMGRHADFWQVTGDALDYAMSSLKLEDPALRDRLMDLYLRLRAYPEVKDTLSQLKAAGMKLAILSNGEPGMLAAAVRNSGIDGILDAVLSVEEVKVFKPHPSVYRLPAQRFGLATEVMCFLSSNAWDAHAAKACGYRVLWCNRFAQAPERIPELPDGVIRTLAELPAIVGA